MKKYIRSSEYEVAIADAHIPFGCYLKSTTGSMDDILVYGNDRKSVIDCGEAIADVFRDAPDIEFRYDEDGGSIITSILKLARQYRVSLAADNYKLSKVAFDPLSNEILRTDRYGSIISEPVNIIRVIRGNYFI